MTEYWRDSVLTPHRYCSAVEAASKPIKNGPPLMPRAFLASLEDLLERLTGTPSANPANIFGGRKPAKPGFDKLGSWIEGRLTKFIAGEEDANSAPAKPAAAPPAKGSSQAPVGPFSHFSTISPGASGQVSRATSIADFHNQNGHLDVQPDSRRTSPRVLSQAQFGAEHTREPSSSSSSYGEQCASQDGAPSGFAPWGLSRNPSQIYADRLDDDTPQGEPSEDHGLLNPMAHLSLASGRDGPSPSSYEPKRPSGGDDDEDLGFGNTSLSRSRTPRPSGEAGAEDRPGTAETKTGDGQKSKAGAAIDASPSKGNSPLSCAIDAGLTDCS